LCSLCTGAAGSAETAPATGAPAAGAADAPAAAGAAPHAAPPASGRKRVSWQLPDDAVPRALALGAGCAKLACDGARADSPARPETPQASAHAAASSEDSGARARWPVAYCMGERGRAGMGSCRQACLQCGRG